MRTRIRGGLAALLTAIGLVTAGCSDSATTSDQAEDDAQNATNVTIEQPEFPDGVLISREPLNEFRSGMYSVLRKNRTDPLELAGYRQRLSDDGKHLSVNNFGLTDNAWKQMSTAQLVWSPEKKDWVESDRSETLSAGPEGSRGWPTVTAVADWGTTYYTIGYRELGSHPLADGLPAGFAEGAALPASVSAAQFSPEARSYFLVTTTVEPMYAIARVRQIDTGQDTPRLVYACGEAAGECKTPATSLQMAIEQRGKFSNVAGNASIELRKNGRAIMTIDGVPLLDMLTYTVAEDDGPPRITFAPFDDPTSSERFAKVFGTEMAHFAFYEYDGQVAIGGIQPANSTRTDDALFNRIAINDLLTHWTPALPPVLE